MGFGYLKKLFTIYSTTRVVQIKSKSLAISYVTLVVLVWFAILKSYQLDLRKIYQKVCPGIGTFTTKVKGVLSTENFSDEELNITSPQQYRRIWDTQDLVKISEGGFLTMTNIVITPNQVRSICTSSSSTCEKDSNCTPGLPDRSFDGLMNGYCNAEGKCTVSAWCPTEEDILPLNGSEALFRETKKFTVLVKNSIEFPGCEDELGFLGVNGAYKRRNLLNNFTREYLKMCRYNLNEHPYCPIFRLEDIVESAGQSYDEVAISGGIFAIVIIWNCDFDWGHTIDDCLPKYKFQRLDVLDSDGIAPGFNWRSATFFEGNRRTLTKHYGIEFLVKVHAEGRKFDFLLLVVTIGATIGLFAFAPLFCDLMFDLFCYLKKHNLCSKWISDSFTKEVRFQDLPTPSLMIPVPLPLPSPPPPPPQRRNYNYFEESENEFYQPSLGYDTKL